MDPRLWFPLIFLLCSLFCVASSFFSATFETKKTMKRPARCELVVDSGFFCRDENNGKKLNPSLCCCVYYFFCLCFLGFLFLLLDVFFSVFPFSPSFSFVPSLSVSLFPQFFSLPPPCFSAQSSPFKTKMMVVKARGAAGWWTKIFPGSVSLPSAPWFCL